MTSSGTADGVGVIGLGAMGHPMATNLLREFPDGVQLTGRDRTRYEDLVGAGARWHDTPRDLADAVAIVMLMLPDLPEVEAVLDGPQGLLAAYPHDLLVIISSTSSPTGVRDLSARLRQEHPGVRVVDAPVSGGVDGAEAGTLSIMVGGAENDVAQALPVLAACGTPVHLGPLGSGQVAKACNQLVVAATVLALGEAAVLADRSGLDLGRCSTCSPAGMPTAGSCAPAGRASSVRTTARPASRSTWSRTSSSPPPWRRPRRPIRPCSRRSRRRSRTSRPSASETPTSP
jgi:2-hydroxy-3-oxopropionate reductase